ESVDTILEMARLKTEGRAQKLVVAGCLVERFRDEIQKNMPEVDAVVGTGELEKILSAAGISGESASTSNSPFVILSPRAEGDARVAQGRFSREAWDGAIADLQNYLYDDKTPRVIAHSHYTAYIKIADGYDDAYIFCNIPHIPSNFLIRSFQSVID